MSSKHLFPSPEGLVVKALRGIISYNPSLSLIEDSKVVYDTTFPKSQVAIISGGGAGHEPAWGGYVGQNMLAASASGDIFASPSTKQIVKAIEAVPSDKGHILVVTNYTGDCLNFGLACEKANVANKAPCGMIICGDDVSVGKKGGLVGRRGLASQIMVLKIMGAASGKGVGFDDLMSLGTAVSEEIVSIAATLDHCHVPGRTEHATLSQEEIEIGTGPHNEPGYRKITPVPSAASFVGTILKYILDESDPDRGYVHFEKGDQVVLLVSNFGGMSPLEMGALMDELLEQLDKNYSMIPIRVYCGPLETSLNAPAFSTSVINLSSAAKKTKFTVEQMLEFLEVRTTTQWESVTGSQTKQRPRKEQFVPKVPETERQIDPKQDLKVDPNLLAKMITKACNDLIAREPDLTKWDTVLGDGDCGETLKTGATALLNSVKNVTAEGSVTRVLYEVENIVESRMGGTLGGILGIFFVAITNNMQRAVKGGETEPVKIFGQAVSGAVKNLQRYTPAKAGDRTVVDALIPFAEGLAAGSFEQAAKGAMAAAEKTAQMQPKLGRATYVGIEDKKELPPDPGAYGAALVCQGLYQGMQ